MQHEQKDAGALIRLAYQGMCNLGIDADTVLVRSGLTEEDLYNSKLRTPHWAQSIFWQAAEDITQDTDIGLHLGLEMPLFKGMVLEYLFISAANFGDGLKRMINYQRLISDAIDLKLITEDPNCEEAYISFDFPEKDFRHLMECMGVVLIKFFKFVSEDALKISLVQFTHKRPEGADNSELGDIFECPVEFGCEHNRIYFAKNLLEFRSLHTQPELLSFHEQWASAQLADLERQDLISDVQQQIASLLESGDVCVETVAQELDIAPRSLRAQLQEAGTSFSQVLNDYRHQLAKKLLAKTNESIAEIVYLTGFSEPSTFYRAFKRWEGVTPVEYRKKKQEKQAKV